MGGFCLLIELHQEGSTINAATLSSFVDITAKEFFLSEKLRKLFEVWNLWILFRILIHFQAGDIIHPMTLTLQL